MTMRHKAVKASLDKGYATEWNDDHHFDPTDRIDWSYGPLSDLFTDIWDTAQSDAGNVPDVVFTGNHAVIRCLTTAAVGEISTMRLTLNGTPADITNPDDLPIYTGAVDVQTPGGAGLTHEFGFFVNADTPFTANQEGAYFAVEANILYACTGTGAAETTTALGAPSQYDVYRIKINSANVEFFVGTLTGGLRVAAATHTTNLPVNSLTIKHSAIAVAAGAQTLNSDAINLDILRKQ